MTSSYAAFFRQIIEAAAAQKAVLALDQSLE